MKRCSKCHLFKDEINFSKDKSKSDGLCSQCRQCTSHYTKKYYKDNRDEKLSYQKQYQKDNKEEVAEYQKQYQKDNKEEKSEYDKQYRQDNKEEIAGKNKQYREDNKEEISKKTKQYYEENKEEILEKAKQYQKDNKEKISKYQQAYKKERRKSDPSYKLRDIVSSSIYKTLKSNGGSKNGKSSAQYLPFTEDQLNDHIESLFSHPDNLTPDGQIWMTWENQGVYRSDQWNDNDPSTWTWQLDHIIPHSTFKYATMDCQEFKDCWSLDNLRPYSAKKNIKEGNRRSFSAIDF